MFWPG